MKIEIFPCPICDKHKLTIKKTVENIKDRDNPLTDNFDDNSIFIELYCEECRRIMFLTVAQGEGKIAVSCVC